MDSGACRLFRLRGWFGDGILDTLRSDEKVLIIPKMEMLSPECVVPRTKIFLSPHVPHYVQKATSRNTVAVLDARCTDGL